jgi:uncharacterized membrane protein HdeD (DUF308 family)
MLATVLSRYWWTTLLRGLLWIVLGYVVLTRPAISLVSLTLLFGAFAIGDGLATMVSAFGGRGEHEHWWVLLLAGLAGIAAGVLTLLNPAITAIVLLVYIALWALVRGALELVTAIRLRREIEGELWLGLAGLASIAFGVMAIMRPGAGALAVLWLIGIYAIAYGVMLVVLGMRARNFASWTARTARHG